MCAAAGERRPFYCPAVEEMVVVLQVADLKEQHKTAVKIFRNTDDENHTCSYINSIKMMKPIHSDLNALNHTKLRS